LLTGFAQWFQDGSLGLPKVTSVGAFSVGTVRDALRLLEVSAARGKLTMSVVSG
jgi:hypothetical protein